MEHLGVECINNYRLSFQTKLSFDHLFTMRPNECHGYGLVVRNDGLDCLFNDAPCLTYTYGLIQHYLTTVEAEYA